MRYLATFFHLGLLALLLLGCQEPSEPGSALELLCSASAEPPAYGEFYWDELRRRELRAFERALEICSKRCPSSPSCGPVLSVAGWYEKVSDHSELGSGEVGVE